MSKQLEFRAAFRWEKEIEDFIKEKTTGYSLNVPCGKSTIGDIKLDIDPKLSMREAFNFFKDKIPFKDNTFDTVISDPPWKIGHYFRPRMFFKLVEVCKIGGMIIYNAPWIPTSKYVELKETYIRQSGHFCNASIISIFKKTADVPNDKKD